MKKVYNTPIVEIIEFKAEDIIVTSVGFTDGPGMGGGNEVETPFE